MKNRLTFISLLLIAVFAIGFASAADTLFSDDFETGTLAQWSTVDSPTITSDSAYVNAGTYAVQFNGGPDPDDLIVSVAIDTTGYMDIEVEYYRLLESLESDNGFVAEYSTNGGSTWTTLEDVYGDESFTQKTYSLPGAAEDNPDVHLRFSIYAGATAGDIAALDDVLVTGTESDAPVVSGVTESPEYPICTDDVEICVDVTDASAITDVDLLWSTSGGDSGTFAMIHDSGDTYCRTLSAGSLSTFDGLDVFFDVYVEDEHGNSDTDTSAGMFTFDCLAPSADANGAYSCDEGSTTPLDATASTDTVDPSLDYAWDLDDDGSFDDDFTSTPSFSCLDDGVYDVAVEVTDDAGHSDTASSTVTVSNVDPAAFANGAYSGDEGSSVALSASETDVGTLDTHTYAWDLDDDGSFETAGQDVSFACIDDSVNDVHVEVTDDDGGVDTDSTTVTCNNVDPVVTAGADQTVNEGDVVTISPTWTDVGVLDTHIYTVDWDDGPLDTLFTHTYCDNGDYGVIVEVTDDDGGIGSDTLTVTVNNVAPTFDNLPYATAGGVEGDTFTYDVDASDVGCDGLEYNLVGGEPAGMTIDSNTGEISWPSAVAGDYVVTVEVDDGDDTVTADLTIHIYKYDIDFEVGANCFSIPLVPADDNKSINAVLGSDVSSVSDIIWAYRYDATAGKNVWTYNEPITDGTRWTAFSHRLQNIEPGYGYYLYADDAVTSFHDGEKFYGVGTAGIPMPPQVHLDTGWNLIGHYGMNNVVKAREVSDLSGGILTDLADLTLLTDEALPTARLEPTECYWTFVTGEDVLLYAPSARDYADTTSAA